MAKTKAVQPPKIEKYEVEAAADTLMKAEQIRADNRLMKRADRELNRREAAIKKVRKRNRK